VFNKILLATILLLPVCRFCDAMQYGVLVSVDRPVCLPNAATLDQIFSDFGLKYFAQRTNASAKLAGKQLHPIFIWMIKSSLMYDFSVNLPPFKMGGREEYLTQTEIVLNDLIKFLIKNY
jgi:hypothetical protein